MSTIQAVAICETSDIPFGEGRSVAVSGRRVGIFNTATGFFAVDNGCPHEGGPLSDGIVGDACVTCPLHGWRINLEDGSGQGREESVRSYDLEVIDGTCWLSLDDD